MLEPIGSLNVTVPDENTGDVMGELNKRRGRVLGMEPVAPGMTLIQAEVPMREMQDFACICGSPHEAWANFPSPSCGMSSFRQIC